MRSRGTCLIERVACGPIIRVPFGTRGGDECLSEYRRECGGGLGALGEQDAQQGQGARAVVLLDRLLDASEDGLVGLLGGDLGGEATAKGSSLGRHV